MFQNVALGFECEDPRPAVNCPRGPTGIARRRSCARTRSFWRVCRRGEGAHSEVGFLVGVFAQTCSLSLYVHSTLRTRTKGTLTQTLSFFCKRYLTLGNKKKGLLQFAGHGLGLPARVSMSKEETLSFENSRGLRRHCECVFFPSFLFQDEDEDWKV